MTLEFEAASFMTLAHREPGGRLRSNMEPVGARKRTNHLMPARTLTRCPHLSPFSGRSALAMRIVSANIPRCFVSILKMIATMIVSGDNPLSMRSP